MRISDWSSDVCSSDLVESVGDLETEAAEQALAVFGRVERLEAVHLGRFPVAADHPRIADGAIVELAARAAGTEDRAAQRGIGDDSARPRAAEPRGRHAGSVGCLVGARVGGGGGGREGGEGKKG